MDELYQEPRPEGATFREDLHHVEVMYNEHWQEAVPEVICNDPDHRLKTGKIDCYVRDLVNENGWEVFSIDDEKRVIAKFGIKYDVEHVVAAPWLGEAASSSYDVDSVEIGKPLPIEVEEEEDKS